MIVVAVSLNIFHYDQMIFLIHIYFSQIMKFVYGWWLISTVQSDG